MKFLWLLLISFLSKIAVAQIDCDKIVPIIDDTVHPDIYNFKQKNGQWHEQGHKHGISYVLEPEKTAKLSFSWTIKDKAQKKVTEGKLDCEIPRVWRLTLTPPVEIIYPEVVHGRTEDLSLYSVKTAAGIYLSRCKYSLPDFARLTWHLKQDVLSQDIIYEIMNEIIADHKFFTSKIMHINEDYLDKTAQVQLIGMNVSNQPEIDQSMQWLIANADDHEDISEGSFKSNTSSHNALLPWYDPSRAEFASRTPHEAYESTIVGPVGILSVFDHSSGQMLPEPLATMDKIQMIYDVLAPAVLNYLDGSKLFVHLVLRQPHDYKLLSFEVLNNGSFSLKLMKSLAEPERIGLPSAHDLGFTN